MSGRAGEIDLRELRKLKDVLTLIAEECEPDIPMGYVRIMVELMIAHIEGGEARQELAQADLQERTGAEQSSVSRAVAALTNARKAIAAEPYEIAESYPHPMDRRYRVVRLNPRGVALLNKIVERLEWTERARSPPV